mmetsp:Transcript_35815/g.82049  ORF Transcript_35815/g.82049 Transcript_35815/m.82049 type:complete len:266 (-) Transcript_35815:416-1213(-)
MLSSARRTPQRQGSAWSTRAAAKSRASRDAAADASRVAKLQLLALGVAQPLEHRVLQRHAVEAALLAGDEDLVEQREHVGLLLDARRQHPPHHAAVEVELLEALAAEGAHARLLEESLQRELDDVRQHAGDRDLVMATRAAEGDLARKHSLQVLVDGDRAAQLGALLQDLRGATRRREGALRQQRAQRLAVEDLRGEQLRRAQLADDRAHKTRHLPRSWRVNPVSRLHLLAHPPRELLRLHLDEPLEQRVGGGLHLTHHRGSIKA